MADADDAVAALAELGGRAAAKLAATSLQHKSDIGALALDIRDADAMREAHDRLMELAVPGASVLVERMAEPGAELLVSARADGVVPSLVIAAGGLWTELLGDTALIPLPATPERVEQAIGDCARRRSSPAGAAARRSTWRRRRGSPRPPASCCSTRGSR